MPTAPFCAAAARPLHLSNRNVVNFIFLDAGQDRRNGTNLPLVSNDRCFVVPFIMVRDRGGGAAASVGARRRPVAAGLFYLYRAFRAYGGARYRVSAIRP